MTHISIDLNNYENISYFIESIFVEFFFSLLIVDFEIKIKFLYMDVNFEKSKNIRKIFHICLKIAKLSFNSYRVGIILN